MSAWKSTQFFIHSLRQFVPNVRSKESGLLLLWSNASLNESTVN